MKFQPKTTEQLRAIFGLGRNLGCEKSDLEEMAADVTGGRVDRLSLLSWEEANAMIRRLGGEPFSPSSGTPVNRRTANYRKQRDGIVTMATPKALAMMDDLAAKRGMSPLGLERMCMRMIKSKRPRTAVACNAVIEAFKSMNARDRKKQESGRPVRKKEAA